MSRSLEIIAPNRLHFGLFSFGGSGRQFGGVGAMIDSPGLHLKICSEEQFESHGEHATRIRVFAENWAEFHKRQLPACGVHVLKAPPEHVGLGLGTQLGLSVAAGLNAFFDLPQMAVGSLTACAQRGLRSAVGAYGFCYGGLVVERGKAPHDSISPLECRLPLPPAWRFVLARPLQPSGLAGKAEQQAFDSLEPVSAEKRNWLIGQVRNELLPAAASADFEAFAKSVAEYGREAGMCFAAHQGGPYNGAEITRLIEFGAANGVHGGQSSWGPTVFFLLENEEQAASFSEQLAREFPAGEVAIHTAAPNNSGMKIVR